jgi:hypothetical protein
MPVPFVIDQRLSKAHRASFWQLCLNPGTTGVFAGAWLQSRGYRISERAVQRFIRSARASGIFTLRRRLGASDDAQTRRQIARWANRMAGDELSHLAMFAVYLLNVQAARHNEKLTRTPGCISMDLKGDRTPK